MVGIFSLYAYPHKSRPFYSVCDDRASNFHRQFNSCLRGMLSVCISAMLSFGRTLVQEDLIRKILVRAYLDGTQMSFQVQCWQRDLTSGVVPSAAVRMTDSTICSTADCTPFPDWIRKSLIASDSAAAAEK